MTCRLIDYSSEYLAHLSNREADKDRIMAAIDAASVAIERYCRRNFAITSYDEILRPDQFGSVVLRNYPMTKLSFVGSDRVPFLTIQNTLHNQASVEVEEDRIVLRNTGSNATAYLFDSYPTTSDMATVLSGDSGWTATSLGSYETDDLIFCVWANAKTLVQLEGWLPTLSPVSADYSTGVVTLTGVRQGTATRITYEAGFSEIPADLQQVCADLAANLYDHKIGTLQSENLGGYSYSVLQGASLLDRLPITSRKILDSYKDRRV